MSSSSGNRLPAASRGGTGSTSTPANSGAGWGTSATNNTASSRRRSSASNTPGLFSGLVNQKRNSVDATAAARKASFNDQQPKPGFLASIWQNYTKGDPNAGVGANSK